MNKFKRWRRWKGGVWYYQFYYKWDINSKIPAFYSIDYGCFKTGFWGREKIRGAVLLSVESYNIPFIGVFKHTVNVNVNYETTNDICKTYSFFLDKNNKIDYRIKWHRLT